MKPITSIGSCTRAEIPVLETDRLRLRAHLIEDLTPLSEMWQDEAVARYIGGRTRAPSDLWAQTQRTLGGWALLGYGYWVITDKATDEFLGEAGFMEAMREIYPSFVGTPEAGWVFKRAAWGKGYASEAVEAICAWGDENFPVKHTVCIIAPAHAASIRVAEKSGFAHAYDDKLGTDDISVFKRQG